MGRRAVAVGPIGSRRVLGFRRLVHAGEHDQFPPGLAGGLGQDLDGAADAVDFGEGIGDPGLVVAGAAEVGRRGEVGGDRLVEPLVFMLRVERRQVGRHAEGHGGQRGDRLQAFHELALAGELDKAPEKVVAQRVADVAGDAERAAVVHQRLGRLLFRLVGEQPAEVGHQLLLRFAELAQLPRHEEPRGEPFQAPAGTLLGRRFQQPLEELAHQRRLAAPLLAADEAVLVVAVGDVIEGVAHQHAAAALAVGLVLAAAQKGQIFVDARRPAASW